MGWSICKYFVITCVSFGVLNLLFVKPVSSGEPIIFKDDRHFVLGRSMLPPYPENTEEITFGMGCFWCSEDLFIDIHGVYVTVVGYSQGHVENPSYQDVSSGQTGHAEVVKVVYYPSQLPLENLLKIFWEGHNPTTLNQQRYDRGTMYRSGIYFTTEKQKDVAEKSKMAYQSAIQGTIVTEIEPLRNFYVAEEYHQQYDRKPGTRDYNGLAPLGISMPSTWISIEKDEL